MSATISHLVELYLRAMVLIALALAISTCAPAARPEVTPTPIPTPSEKYLTPGDYVEAITLDGVERQFIIHIPPGYQLDTPMPLVINLHGRGGSALQQERVSRMNAKADKEGFVVVNPQALGRPTTWWPAPGPRGQADLEFFQEMVAFVQRQINIDPARIYIAGLSNGGAMANRLACTMSDKIAAIASVAGAHPQMESCTPTLPVSVIVIHGQRDDVVPYMGDGGYLPPVQTWTAAWARRNDCEPTPIVDSPYKGTTRQTWENCSGNTAVMLYTLEGGGHEWPGSGFGPGPYLEGMRPDVYATDLIWDFFESHPRPSGIPAR